VGCAIGLYYFGVARLQQAAQAPDTSLDEQLEIHRAGLVLAETVVEGVVDPVEAQERRAASVRPVQKRTVFAAPVL
jgi:hypothetical protein